MNILVTGGAGYIGSHVVKLLGEEKSHNITIIDNLSTGRKKSILYGNLVNIDLSDFVAVENVFKEGNFDAVIHFAAHIVVPESVSDPLKYYMNNTINSTNLIKQAVKYGVKNFIFSSTAAVYGEPAVTVVSESDTPTVPINPYGMSKLMTEFVLRDSGKAYSNFKFVILRYFNVAGADVDGKIGQCFPNATHLIKVAAQTALGQRKNMAIFGSDFNTIDGTGVRDYIHVTDLGRAHLSALKYLANGGDSDIFNCGYGQGFSVKQVIDTMKKISGVDFAVEIAGRRAGDPAALIADNSKILSKLDWKPKYNDLELICKTAYIWEKRILEEGK